MQYIQKSYDQDPSLYSSDIDTLHKIRQSAMAVLPSVSTVNQITVLKRYYAHLVRLTDKFPKLLEQQESNDDDVTGPTPLIFTWLGFIIIIFIFSLMICIMCL